MTPAKQAWLSRFTWSVVEAQNRVLCTAKNAFHGPTSDGHERTCQLWEESHKTEMTLSEVISLCRRCHKMAPFCFYNGNTFAAVARAVITSLNLEAHEAFIVRSLAGHIVAGVATGEEEAAFQRFSDEHRVGDRDRD